MGRTAAGVRGIKLGKGDKVVSAGVITGDSKDPQIMVLSENGFGKRTKIEEYKVQNRGGSGIKTAKVTSKTGMIMSAKIVTESDEELVAISKKGQVIRITLNEIPTLGRQTQGVRIMKLRAGDSIASLICF
jgi:DNA gyrase subunit A